MKLLVIPSIFISISLCAQVGVNTISPSQTLDVNGQIQVGIDSTATDEEGTIRYNPITQNIEGYSNGVWKTMTSANLGANAEYVQVYEFGAAANSTWDFPSGSAVYTNTGGASGSAIPVPSNRVLVIDQICVTATSPGSTVYFYAGVRKSTAGGGGFNPQVFISGSSADGNSCLQGNKAPLMVINAGNTIQVWNSSSSSGTVRIIITGFLLDSLDEYYGL